MDVSPILSFCSRWQVISASKGWSKLIYSGSLSRPFLSLFPSHEAVSLRKQALRETVRPKYTQPLTVVWYSCLFNFMNPYSLESTSVSWTDFSWCHCSDIQDLGFGFDDN